MRYHYHKVFWRLWRYDDTPPKDMVWRRWNGALYLSWGFIFRYREPQKVYYEREFILNSDIFTQDLEDLNQKVYYEREFILDPLPQDHEFVVPVLHKRNDT